MTMFLIAVLKYFRRPIVKLSAPNLMVSSLIGGILLNLVMLLQLGPNTDASCLLRYLP